MDKVIYLERMLSIYILECKPISFYKNFTIVSSVTEVKVFYHSHQRSHTNNHVALTSVLYFKIEKRK